MSWNVCTIVEIATVKGGKRLPKGHELQSEETNHPYIRARDIGEGKITFSDPTYLSEDTHRCIKNYVVAEGDIVITIVGANIGDIALIPEQFAGANLTENAAKLVLNREVCDPEFLKYQLANDFVKLKFSHIASGAAQGKLGLYKVKSFEIRLPSLDVQVEIAQKLKNYDDLIENNRRRIQLLEESARLLYREWFVQLRFPGHEHVKIVDGVPEGWAHLTVGTLLGKIKRKGKVKKDDYKADGVLACVDQSKEFIGGYIDSTELAIVDELPILVFGDHTRVVKYIDFPFAPGADGTQLLIPKSNEIPRVFFYFLIAGINLANAFYARHFKFLKATEVLVPKKELMRLFEDSVSTNMNQISLLREQNKKLSKARDILLPRLMNGTLTV